MVPAKADWDRVSRPFDGPRIAIIQWDGHGGKMESPIQFCTSHRAQFSQLDPYGHLNSEQYLGLFLAHRFQGMREVIGWGLKEIMELPIAFYLSQVNVEFIRPVLGDQEFQITSQVTEFRNSDCSVLCQMTTTNEKVLAKCEMAIVSIDQKTQRPCPWPEEVIQKFYQEP